jgi:serine/threonine-protein kinase
MGEVYRAKDNRLERDVAIKVLRADVAGDRDRISRFAREARILAALSHQNIAGIIGLEDDADTPALVMELVEGPTLALRIDAGPLPLDDALDIAGQIAAALEAAHERGIIHRDLKPANVKVRPDGLVKVLDFGLAKAFDTDPTAPRAVDSSTLTAMTTVGAILGTASYMAPEQAKGRPVDRRADIWACGCVLYEMLTGRRAFEGDGTTETIAAVVSREPDWTALPAGTPAALRRLLQRMLVKDPKLRIDSAAVVRLEIAEAAAALKGGATRHEGARAVAEPGRWAWWPMVGTGVLASLAASLATWALASRPAPAPAAPVTRFLLSLPASQPLAQSFNAPDIALSPAGTHLAYTVGLQSQLMIRALDRVEAAPLVGITGARAPFFSPDGRWIGYFDQAGELWKVSIDGGRPVAICKVDGTSRGASWGPDDTIVFATSTSGGLLSVPGAGGAPAMLAAVSAGASAYVSPTVLPDGHGIVFTVIPDGAERPYVARLDGGGTRTTLVRDAAQGGYVDGGYLTYEARQSLWAVGFSPAAGAITGTPVRVIDNLEEVRTSIWNVALSRHGTLAYAHASGDPERTLVWIDRAGVETPVPAPARPYHIPRLSGDAARLVAVIPDLERGNADLWTWDLARAAGDQTLQRFTFEPRDESYPVWSRDGRIIYNSIRDGVQNIFRRTSDLGGNEERVTSGPNNQRPLTVSADGRQLIFEESTTDNAWNLLRLTLDGVATPDVVLATPFDERNADLSPDGRWLAYDSNETGRTEVFVRPFPDVTREVFQVSSNGGRTPAWSPAGGELFFTNGATLYSVAVQLSPGFRHAPPVALFDKPSVLFDGRQLPRGSAARQYDVSRDGRRFLAMKMANADDSAVSRLGIVVVQNWFENAAASAR